MIVFNTTAAVAYLQFFSKPSATLGTDTPDLVVPVGPNQNLPLDFSSAPIVMGGQGLCMASTTDWNNNTGAAQDVSLILK